VLSRVGHRETADVAIAMHTTRPETRANRVEAVPAEPPGASKAGRKQDFHTLEVKAVVEETADAVSIAFAVPSELRQVFSYLPGQFVTLRVEADGQDQLRSYSMSSSPGIDDDLQVTIKRVAGGVVSNWLVDHVGHGDRIDVSAPSGSFVLQDADAGKDVVAFAAGSGITPIFSVIKFALADTERNVRMLFANRDRPSAIFHSSLQALESTYPGRLQIEYSFDEDSGFADGGDVARMLGTGLNSDVYICGPAPFMDMVVTTLVWCGARSDQLHVERFTPEEDDDHPPASEGAEVTVTLRGRTVTVTNRSHWTLVQAARTGGLMPPSSCHLGQCATCVARITEGQVEMRNNQILTPEEVAEGWVLTCQARPLTPRVSVVYE
jgi:3-ketosteroid 9alpha-monooxygenase subunit B